MDPASPPKGGGRDRQVAEGALVGRKGFTLVEIMTVIAIVGLLSAMAIPNLLRSRLDANETAAQAALKTIASAMTAYRSVNPAYPSNLQQLGSAAVGGETLSYLDDAIAQGARTGYHFVIEESDAYTFLVRATPQTLGVTGNRTFTLTQLGTIQLARAEDTTGEVSPNEIDPNSIPFENGSGDTTVATPTSTTSSTDATTSTPTDTTATASTDTTSTSGTSGTPGSDTSTTSTTTASVDPITSSTSSPTTTSTASTTTTASSSTTTTTTSSTPTYTKTSLYSDDIITKTTASSTDIAITIPNTDPTPTPTPDPIIVDSGGKDAIAGDGTGGTEPDVILKTAY